MPATATSDGNLSGLKVVLTGKNFTGKCSPIGLDGLQPDKLSSCNKMKKHIVVDQIETKAQFPEKIQIDTLPNEGSFRLRSV